ncbi:YbhB/YbcL family Raf kinase inhibitor-like protein [Corynebacterium sp. ES2794-CONJ1]|uniref:YbhB/YbcL family Raf kinase inhibitor-like protein n=1 Tax=unclassified Corynebacterium TaxID=2624378 RepID=UPI00216AABB7|nr:MULTISPECIES: YbhB/YbcL family Raf kinase inhibitor-like protein [unclassified Corynebacterium]MCS4489326.1 YbhB/YbcL family Raf kinase inhibitor-like protein [Corynebacterium sp. ES2775-CONJ]MCS4491139.1 YbhB/YbcL family Raf kinase inhibitor-like protein [Corynebacterium sp. ES2715-CONJ3]MCS4530980.1 YbhB/YbcL family Raf kinase inhibitor-like protein [Corynebacterium sp. ES2730-CONJ]MCU9518347.1 YbhB/YbcL family Raf kinase inhibitor-like protein [Corynebacterium sp. ES2794-CONJ1]
MTSYAHDPRFPGPDPYAPLKNLPSFPLVSEDFANGDRLPSHVVAPGSVSPHLRWSQLPEGTKSLAITCFDPDAPTASGYWHWAVFNIPASVTEIPAGAGSAGGVLTTHPGVVTLAGDSGLRSHYGANPPSGHGPHRYLYAVHALDVDSLEIEPTATAAVLGFHVYFHSLGRAIYWGWYENE